MIEEEREQQEISPEVTGPAEAPQEELVVEAGNPESPEVSSVETEATPEAPVSEEAADGVEPVSSQPEEEAGTNGTPNPREAEMKWYVVHTYSGYEAKAKKALDERAVSLGKSEFFGEVLIPTENVVEMVQGEKKTTTRKFFPGYIFVKMLLNDETWYVVKDTPKVTGFVGGGRKPTPVPEKEVKRLTQQISEGTLRPKLKMTFEKGESVRVVDGPFQNFNGLVDEVKPDKGKLRVLVSIFGRSTPVELDYGQVEKN